MFFDITIDLKNSVALIIPADPQGDRLPVSVSFMRLDVDHPNNITLYDEEDNPVRIFPRTSVREINFQDLAEGLGLETYKEKEDNK